MFANGPLIAERYAALSERTIHSYPNSIDADFLERLLAIDPASVPALPGRPTSKKVVYTGNINDRFDLRALNEVVEQCDEFDFVLVGPVTVPSESAADWERLRRRANVFHRPPVAHDQLPAILARADALLLPYHHRGGDVMFPGKLFEYMATVKPIFATVDYASGMIAVPSMRYCETTQDMAVALQDISSGKWTVSDDERQACIRIARENTWARRAEEFAELTGLCSGAPCRSSK